MIALDELQRACRPGRIVRLEHLGDAMALFGRRERREERRGAVHYRMREKLVAIGDDYWIEDDAGQRVFKVNGKALRIRDTLIFEDASGNELLKIQQRMLHVRDTMEIEDAHGDKVATVKKALITPLRDRFEVHVENGHDMEVHGNIVDHEYRIERDGKKVAEVSRKWFRVADTYGVEADPTQDTVLLLAVTAALDQMTR